MKTPRHQTKTKVTDQLRYINWSLEQPITHGIQMEFSQQQFTRLRFNLSGREDDGNAPRASKSHAVTLWCPWSKKMVQKESHLTMTATFSTNYYIIGFIFTTILFGQLTHNLETSWRFQPRWKIWSSNWIISPSRDENWKKCLSCHHLPPSFEMYPIPKPPKHPQGVAVELPNKDPPASIMAAFSCTSSHGSLVFQQNAAV